MYHAIQHRYYYAARTLQRKPDNGLGGKSSDWSWNFYLRIDQEAEAVKAGLTLKPMKLLIFGNPRGGIPLMNANPLSGLDLPLKILIWEDNDKKVWLSYNSFSYLQKRFDLPVDLIQKISGVEKIIQQAISN